MPGPGLSDSAAARVIGISRQAVAKAADAGRILRLEDGGLDPASVAEYSTGRRAPRGGATRPKVTVAPGASVDGDAARNAREAIEMLVASGMYADRQSAELARDSFTARLKQLEFEQRSGKLLERDAVDAAIAKACSSVRTAILAIPAERSPEVHRCKTVAEVQDVLRSILVEALEALSEGFAWGKP